MEHYKSWSDLKKQLQDGLCDALQGRITYFLTRYHDVHNAYGRAAIRLDGRELVCFDWIEMYRQERDTDALWVSHHMDSEEAAARLKPRWDAGCTWHEMDFLSAALQFRQQSIQDALRSENYIIRIFAVLDRRVGKRTLQNIAAAQEYAAYPDWVRQFYELRLSSQLDRFNRER